MAKNKQSNLIATVKMLNIGFINKQARSQDLEKGGRGFFERVRKVQTTLTRIFIVLESVSLGLSKNWDGISRKAWKFKRFFRPKTSGLQKKTKKRSSPKLRKIFRPKSEIQTFFPPKKRSSPKLRLIFRPKSEIQTLFHTESQHLLHNFGTQFPLGGCFQFFTKNRPQKHQKRAILHTSQANGGARAPPPPWLRYCQQTYYKLRNGGGGGGGFLVLVKNHLVVSKCFPLFPLPIIFLNKI